MSSRLNQLFQVAPASYLERTVLFTDSLSSRESLALTANRLVHHVDIEPINTRSRVRVLTALHQYADVPMVSYVVPLVGFALVPKNHPPHDIVFLPEFTCCRLLVRSDEEWLHISIDRDLHRMLPPPEAEPDSQFCDSVNYWEFITDNLVGSIRGTAVLVKEPDKPWRFVMQQIVGAAGHEVVRTTFSRDLRYPEANRS